MSRDNKILLLQLVKYVVTAVIAFLSGNTLASCVGIHVI